MNELKCCFIDETGVQCTEKAEWEFYTQPNQDLTCHSCVKHLSELLEDGVSIVYPIELEKSRL